MSEPTFAPSYYGTYTVTTSGTGGLEIDAAPAPAPISLPPVDIPGVDIPATELPPILLPTPSAPMTTADGTGAPTTSQTLTYSPTYHPTKTYKPTEGVETASPTFFPTYYTDTQAPSVKGDGNLNVGVAANPTAKPTFGASESDTISGTDEREETPPVVEDPAGSPVEAPTKPTQEPTAPSGTTSAGVKGPRRRKTVGFQSNWGPAHPGSMIYDFTRNSIYVTGTTFAPNKLPATPSSDFQRSTCFVGEMPIADIEEWKTVDDPVPPEAIGNVKNFLVPDSMRPKEIMACHMIYYDDLSETDDNLYVGGVFEKDATDRFGGVYPFLNTMQRNRNNPDWKLQRDPVKLYESLSFTGVQYPVAMAKGIMQGKDDIVVVVSVSSESTLMTEEYIENGDANNKKNSKNSLLPPGLEGNGPSKYAVPKRGDNYVMKFQQYDDKNGELTLRTDVEYRAGKSRFKSGGDVMPTGILNLNPADADFIVSGHFKGLHPSQWPNIGNKSTDDDMDGFAAKMWFPRGYLQDKYQMRFSSVEENPLLDDFVQGICPGPLLEDGLVHEYYVVGSTYGTMPKGKKQMKLTTNILNGKNEVETDGNKINKLSAWISKIDAKGAFVVWTTQLYAITNDFTLDGGMTEAFGCHIIDSSPSEMYVGGTVYGGGVLDSNHESAGGDDVWVTKLLTEDGSLQWIRQIGSSGNDRIARTNGIEVDINGHAIVYGETSGEMYRKREGEPILRDDGTSTDLFVTTFDRDSGESESTVESDRAYKKERRGLTAGLSVFFTILVLAVAFYLYKKFKPRRGRSRPSASGANLNTAFKDEPDGDDDEEGFPTGGYSDSSPKSAPPAAAFQEAEVKIV